MAYKLYRDHRVSCNTGMECGTGKRNRNRDTDRDNSDTGATIHVCYGIDFSLGKKSCLYGNDASAECSVHGGGNCIISDRYI